MILSTSNHPQSAQYGCYVLINVIWLVGDQATTFGSTVFIKVSFHSRWFKQILLRTNPLLWYDFSVAVFFSHYKTPPPQHILHGSFKLLFLFFLSIFSLPPPLSLVRAFLILYLLHIFLRSFPYQYYIFRIAVSVFIFLRIAVSVFFT